MEKLFNPYKQFLGSFIPNCLMEYEGLTATAKLCWARLAQYAGKDGRCYPMQETIAKEIGISTVQVKRILKELETKGFIYIKKPTGQDRLLHKNNIYFFIKHEVFDISGSIVDDTSVGIVDDTSKIIDKENHKKENHIQHDTFFEQLWSAYPKPVGKKDAYRHYKASVKTEQDKKDISAAMQSYIKSEPVQREIQRGSTQYIQNGSTWFNNWRDYVSLTIKAKPKTILNYL